MKKTLGNFHKRILPFLVVLLCAMMIVSLLPSDMSDVYAADCYYNVLVEYAYPNASGSTFYNHGYYFAPKAPGKYPCIVMIHGQGGMKNMKPHMLAFMNDWVKAGWFEPAVVVMPEINNNPDDHLYSTGEERSTINFTQWVDNQYRWPLLYSHIKDGSLCDKIDTTKPVQVAGYSMGGMTALQIGCDSRFRDEIFKIGSISPSRGMYLGDGNWGYYNYKKDIYCSKDPRTTIFLTYGDAERGEAANDYNVFEEAVTNYSTAITTTGNNDGLDLVVNKCPSSWGSHAWPLFQKEIFMWMYLNKNGELPSVATTEAACSYRMPTTPEVVSEELDLSNVTLPSKLIDLDMSGYTKDTTTNPSSGTSSIGNVTNSGTRGASTRVVMSNYDTSNSQKLEKKTFTNGAGETTPYLEYTKNTTLVQTANNKRFISDSILETQANTISFWAKVTPGQERRNILHYQVNYGSDLHVLRLCSDSSTSTLYLCNGWDDSSSGKPRVNINDTNGKWAHYVITNPAYDSNGSKTLGVYIDGSLAFEKTVTKPSGTLQSAKLAFGGEADGNHSIYFPDSLALSEIEVYNGVLNTKQIYKINELGANRFDAEATQVTPDDPDPVDPTEPTTVDLGDTYLELDMTNLVPESYTPTVSSVAASSGITKSGDWAGGTTLGFSQRPNGETTLKKGSFQNAAGGTTNYLDYYNSVIYPNVTAGNSYAQHLINLQMHNNSFESADNTISFWVDVTKSNVWKEIMCYRVDYTSGGSKSFESFDLGVNSDGTWNAVSAPASANPDNRATGAFSVSDGWKHVVITNPARSGNTKTMSVYVNGALKKTVTLDIPNGATINRATISFFSKSIGSDTSDDGPWRTREAVAPAGKIGDFKIYQGVLSASAAGDAYSGSVNKFTETGAVSYPQIEGYTLSNKTVAYDRATHMIYVSHADNATDGVSITYTSNGSAFTGASEVGSYPVTATIKKSGYDDLVLNATLTINSATVQPEGPQYATSAEDIYSGKIVRYELNSECTGYYFTPKKAGKYPTIILIHGQGSVTSFKERLQSNFERWVKAGYFPPMNVVIPEVQDYTGGGSNIDDFQYYIIKSQPNRFNALLTSIEAGTLSSQIGTDKPIYVAGFSMGGMAAVYAGDEYNTRLKYVGGLSPAKSYYLGESSGSVGWGFRYWAKDIHFSQDDDAHVYLSAGTAEQNGDFVATINRYEQGIAYNNPDVVTKFVAPSGWGGHSWALAQKEIFMYLHFVTYGTIPSQSLVESVCNNPNSYTSPTVIYEEEEHTGEYVEPETITGYTFTDSSVVYDGASHNITVTAGANATQGVDIAYTSGGSAFTGATEVGTYPITATITKSGCTPLVLSATLTILAQQTPPTPIEEGDVLVDVDVTNMAADVGTFPYSGTSGAALGGDWANTTNLVIRSKDGVTIDKASFDNAAGGTTDYIALANSNSTWETNTIGFNFSNADFEAQNNTISFWIDATKNTNKNTELMQYYVEYDGGTASFDLSVNTEGKWNAQNNATATTSDCYSVPEGWKHIVITNPVRSGGSKTMDVYLNGVLKDSVTLSIPDNASITNATVSFAARNQGDGFKYRVPTAAQYGDIKVYSGVMSADDIAALYGGQLSRFTEAGTPSLENITGYTFEDASYEFDAATHNILVSAAIGATEDVDIAYTCNGAAFTGASEVGTYPVTATITKAGYNDLVLNATLTIEPAQSQPIDDGDILVELDLTDFAKSNEAGSSGIVNIGTSTTAEIDAYSSDDVALTTDYIYDKDDISSGKKVIRLTHSDLNTVLSAKQLDKHFELSDPAFEEQDITLSFWTNLDPVSKQNGNSAFTSIVQYNAKRDDGTFRNQADGTSSRARLWQYSLDTSPYYYWGNAWGYEIVMNNSKQWHHVVMTIPKFRGGAKTVNIYVDGALGLTQEVNLGGHELAESFISFGSDENKAYVSTDISFADIKVYAGAMSEEGITNLYNNEKDAYDNIAYTKLGATKDGSAINKLSDLESGDTITISYAENVTDGTRIFAACYDEEGTLLSTNTAEADGEGSFELDIPEGFASVKIYTWNGLTLAPIQKATTLFK